MLKRLYDQRKEVHSVFRISTSRVVLGTLLHMVFWFYVGIVFYGTATLAVLVSLIGLGYAAGAQKKYTHKQKQRVSMEFEQVLYGVSTSLQAGKSVENAFRSVESDIRNMNAGQGSLLLKELEGINRKVEQGIPLERALDDFQKRFAITEIANWAEMFRTCKRTGGDLVGVMRHTSRAIVENMNLDRELSVLIAGKRFEARALSVVPYCIVGLFRYGAPDYMEPLYGGAGRLIMTGSLLVFLGANWMAEKIMRLEGG